MQNNDSSTNYRIMINTEQDTVFIQLKDEKYKEVIAKVGHIEWNDKGEVEFDMEVPAGQEKYYEDDEFCSNIQMAVGDIVAKSVNTFWNDAEKAILNDLDSKVARVMTPYKIDLPEGKSYIEVFGEKGFVISEDDDDKLIAIKPTTEEIYHFDDEDDFAFLRKEVFGSLLIL